MPVSGHSKTSPEPRLAPVPGDLPGELPPFLRRCFGSWRGALDVSLRGRRRWPLRRGVCPQGPGPWVVGEGDLARTQVADHILLGDRARHVDSAPGAAPSALCGGSRACEEGGQVRQDVVLADVEVLRPGGVR